MGWRPRPALGRNAEFKDRCRMELDFRKDPTILSTVVDAMSVAVFTVDAQGNFVAWSEGAERITGYAAGEVIGKPCHLLEGPNCKGFATLAELLRSSDAAPQGIFNQECKLLAKDGRELYIFGSVRLLRDERGKPQGAVGSFSDMTPFVQANEKIALLEEQTRSRTALGRLLGKSESMQEVFRRLRLAAQSDVTVLITGESGSGKELAAAAIHSLSARSERPFLGVNCSAIPESLLESELFGHVRGAFTGAVRDKVGMFQAADGGTLFLDEIGDVSPLLQVKLLRVLQEREIRRVGDERAIKVDVRLLTATNRDLKSLIQSGQMREDFYYRIRVFEIVLPPLRERREDIPLLVTHFIEEFARSQSKQVSGIARDALARMMHYRWPGNVRELKNAIEHAFVTVSGDRITLLDLPTEIRNEAEVDRQSARPPELSPEAVAERQRILEALKLTGGSRTEAARRLGISRVTLWKRMRKVGLEQFDAAE
jgi:PAS domain S-box-containing protein